MRRHPPRSSAVTYQSSVSVVSMISCYLGSCTCSMSDQLDMFCHSARFTRPPPSLHIHLSIQLSLALALACALYLSISSTADLSCHSCQLPRTRCTRMWDSGSSGLRVCCAHDLIHARTVCDCTHCDVQDIRPVYECRSQIQQHSSRQYI